MKKFLVIGIILVALMGCRPAQDNRPTSNMVRSEGGQIIAPRSAGWIEFHSNEGHLIRRLESVTNGQVSLRNMGGATYTYMTPDGEVVIQSKDRLILSWGN